MVTSDPLLFGKNPSFGFHFPKGRLARFLHHQRSSAFSGDAAQGHRGRAVVVPGAKNGEDQGHFRGLHGGGLKPSYIGRRNLHTNRFERFWKSSRILHKKWFRWFIQVQIGLLY